MLTEQKLPPTLQILDPITKSVVIDIVILILRDGVEVARETNSMTFQSSQLVEVKDFLGVDESPEITYLTSIWEL